MFIDARVRQWTMVMSDAQLGKCNVYVLLRKSISSKLLEIR